MRWNTSATSPATERMLVPCQDEQVFHSGDVEDPGGKVTKDMRNRRREAERGQGLLPWQAVVSPSDSATKIPGCPSLAPGKPIHTSPREHNTEDCDCEESGINIYQMLVWGQFKMKT